MPRITESLISNSDEAKEPAGVLVQKGVISHWPPVPNPPKKNVSGPEIGDRPKGPVSVAEQRAAGVPAEETVTMAEQKAGKPLHADEEEGDESSAGSSSSTSDDKRDKSGDSARATARSRQSPAHTTVSPSDKGQPLKQAQSSSVSSAGGSTQETGPSRQSQSSSSGAETDQTEATQGQSSPKATQAKSPVQGDS